MHVYYNRQDRPHSMLWSNGESFNYYRLVDANDKNVNKLQVKSMFSNHQALAYYKRTSSSQNYLIADPPLNIAITEFFYFILHKECLTVVSRITEKFEKCFDVIILQLIRNYLKLQVLANGYQ